MGPLEIAGTSKAQFGGFPDNQVVVQGQAQGLGPGADLFCHGEVRGRRGWIA